MPGYKGQVPIGLVVFFFILACFIPFLILGFPIQKSFVGLIAITLFAVAFLNTDIALILVILSMLLSPELRAGQLASRNINVRAEDLFIFVIFFAWMAKMAVKKELGVVRRNPLNGPIMIYILICVVSSLNGMIAGRVQFREAFFYLLKYFEYFLIFFMVGNNLHTSRQLKTYVFFIILTCLIVCLIAWVQIPSGERISAPFESEGGEPNTFAGYLLLMMSLMLGFFIYAQKRKEKIFWFGSFVFAFVPFVMTMSREGWVSIVPMLLVYIILSRRARYPLLFFLIMAALLLPYVTPQKVRDRAQDTFAKEKTYTFAGRKIHVSESTAARIEAWRLAMQKLSMRPVIGAGVPGGSVIDNQYVRVLIETGFLGFTAFMWMISQLFRMAVRVYKQSSDDFARSLSIGFICGFIALLTQSMGGAVFILIRVMEPFWFLAAMVLAMPEVVAEEKASVQEGQQHAV
ncbi:MAG TPA: O-antigen ligase family protein [Candidatus Omnitrophota bacterium]|nr:O-antigen ligase family protein [Candidatus Omnitrophota bacterium]